MERYIGLDVHAASCTMVVVNENGKRLLSEVVETSARTLIDAVKRVGGKRHLLMEEGTQSAWLYESLRLHVVECVVMDWAPGHSPWETRATRGTPLLWPPSANVRETRYHVETSVGATRAEAWDARRTQSKTTESHRGRGAARRSAPIDGPTRWTTSGAFLKRQMPPRAPAQ